MLYVKACFHVQVLKAMAFAIVRPHDMHRMVDMWVPINPLANGSSSLDEKELQLLLDVLGCARLTAHQRLEVKILRWACARCVQTRCGV